MHHFLRRHWFLSTLALLIVSGMTAGLLGYGPIVKPIVGRLNPRWITACVLFLMAFSLNSDHLSRAFRAPAPVVVGCLVNFGLVPLLAWALLPIQRTEDFRFGLMIAASVPCTTAAASVMTRKARGNDAVSLLVTVATNLSCFVLTPLWLRFATATDVQLPTGKLVVELLEAVLAPTVTGQLLRRAPVLREIAARHKLAIGVAAQILIEVMVVTASLGAGMALHDMRHGQPVSAPQAGTNRAPRASDTPRSTSPHRPPPSRPMSVAGLGLVWGSCVLVHLASLGAGWWLARRTGSARAEAAAAAFAGSQKTLPIGIYVAGLFGEAYPFAMFPMLLYHTSQLFLDTWLASRMATRADETRPIDGPPS